ncbi:MAG: hypothetical protein HPY83_13540 [Anaerolineae bacterium]|nr:hypothetical protein [Anaerolineae bacterium]
MSTRPRQRGTDIFLPVFLILIGVAALLVNASGEEWDLWRIILLALPILVLSIGINLAAENRRMATAVVVTVVGAALLARQTGLVAWPVLPVISRAWPLVVVALGLDLAVGRTTYLRLLLSAALGVALVAAGIWVSAREAETAVGRPSRSVAYVLDDAGAASVSLSPGAATVLIQESTEPATLLGGAITPDPGQDLAATLEIAEKSARLSLTRSGEVASLWPISPLPEWDLVLTSGVPLDLDLDLGAGQCRLDLSGLQVRSLEVSVGVGECLVTLPAVPTLRARITGGIGRTEVVLPAGIEARVAADTGLATTRVEGDLALVGEDDEDEYVTPGYAAASVRAEIQTGQAIGALVIRRP